jgi:hypothetical protein
MSIERSETVQALLIFSLAEEWKRVLRVHGCTFGVYEEYGDMIRFPEGTTRTLLYGREGQTTNHYRIMLPDTLELREILDDKGQGKSWLALVLSPAPLEDVHMNELLQGETAGRATENAKRIARRIAYTIATHTIRQAIADEFLSHRNHSRMLVIYELYAIAGTLEKGEQQLIEELEELPEGREGTSRKEGQNG